MVRRSRFALTFVAAVATIAWHGTAVAQSLPRLHVISFTMRADTMTPRAGQPFHLEIAGRLKEPLSGVDFVVLPNLAGLEPLGDERHALTSPAGTNFGETLTVVAHNGGIIRLGGAYFDAIDPRDGKPKRYYSNDLVVKVSGSAPPVEPAAHTLRNFLLKLLAALFVVFVGAMLLFGSKTRSAPVAPLAQAPPVDAAPAPSEDGLQRALEKLKVDRSRACVMTLRRELWKSAGAHGGETLSELLSRNGAASGLQTSLRFVERAAFVAEGRLAGAIADALAAVEAQLR